MDRRDEFSHDLTREIFQFEEALKSPLVQQIVAAVNEEHKMNPDIPIDVIMDRYTPQYSVDSSPSHMSNDTDGIYSVHSPMRLDNKQQIEESHDLNFIDDLNSLQLNSNKQQYSTINGNDLQQMDMSLCPGPSYSEGQSVRKKIRTTGHGRKKSRPSPASVASHLHDHRYSNTPLQGTPVLPLILDDPLAIRINEDISHESGIIGGNYKDDIHLQYQQDMSDVFCDANDQKPLDVDFIGQTSVLTPCESNISDYENEIICHSPYFTPPYSNNPSPDPETTFVVTALSPSPSVQDDFLTPSPASCSSYDSPHSSVAGPSSGRTCLALPVAGPSKSKPGPRSRPGPSTTRLRRLSSSSNVVENSKQRAKRMSLADLSEEEKRNRIRDQNNDASRRYREKTKIKKLTLPQQVKHELDEQEQLQKTYSTLQNQMKVLRGAVETLSLRKIIPRN